LVQGVPGLEPGGSGFAHGAPAWLPAQQPASPRQQPGQGPRPPRLAQPLTPVHAVGTFHWGREMAGKGEGGLTRQGVGKEIRMERGSSCDIDDLTARTHCMIVTLVDKGINSDIECF
jgi:hypothetical protein